MLHLLVAIFMGIIAYVITGLVTEHRIALLIGLIFGILWYFMGPWGM